MSERLHLAPSLDSLAPALFVIEAVVEDLPVKESLYRELAHLLSPEAIVASNTSSLPIARLASAYGNPSRLGMHFFTPVHAMQLVEVIPTPATDPAAKEVTVQLAWALRKTPVLARDTPGFIVRLARPFYLEALRMAGEGFAPLPVIDTLARGLGFPLAPFRLMDVIGNDNNFAVSTSVFTQFHGEPRYRPHWIQEALVNAGRFGRQNGAGHYQYGPGGEPLPGVPAEPVPQLGPEAPAGLIVLLTTNWSDAERLLSQFRQASVEVLVEEVTGPKLAAGLPPLTRKLLERARAVVDLCCLPKSARLQVAAQLDGLLPPGALILAGVATVSATELASDCTLPARMLGLGGFPPYIAGNCAELVLPVNGSAGWTLDPHGAAVGETEPRHRVLSLLGGTSGSVRRRRRRRSHLSVSRGPRPMKRPLR